MARRWEADPSAQFAKLLGKSAAELGRSKDEDECPDIWQLSSGDVAVIGCDLTDPYRSDLPDRVNLGPPSAAKADIPDV
ncbi:hypothetical protein ACFV19_23940 [Streptomyces griseoluteus]|uniref:hypothetical protein n=1 Tax=Streptomyces griseoluteus TaxID=29306 RepID=UPI0036A32E48